jgi:hypothetical protein
MRCSCLGRASLFALLLLVLVLSAMRGVAGSWDATPVGAVDWRVFAAGVSDAARALVGTAADFGGRIVGTIWAGLTAVPWLRAGEAAAGFVGDVLAGFLALLRDLGAALVALVAGIGRAVAHGATSVWEWLLDRGLALASGPSGEPLDRGRLALFAGGWAVLLIMLAWLVLRLIAGWLRSLRGRITNRCRSPSRPRSHARV